MTPELEDEGIDVVKSTTVTLFRQIIHLASQAQFIPTFTRMHRLMRLGKFSGHIKIQMVQGGVKKIETEEETKTLFDIVPTGCSTFPQATTSRSAVASSGDETAPRRQ